MYIKKIQIENYQSYCGDLQENEFIFDKGVNIVAGKIGAGKSKLFNAFHWALFGNIYSNLDKDWIQTKNLGLRFLCNRAKNECAVGNKIRTSVKLFIDVPLPNHTGETITYTFWRKIVAEKLNDSIEDQSWKITSPEKLEISYVQENGETIYVDEYKNSETIDRMFPPQIRKYMWFQGEAIDKLLDFNNPKTLKHAIQQISYFPFYERLSKLSSGAKAAISKKINNHLKASDRHLAGLNELISKIDKDTKILESREKEREETNEDVQKVKEALVDCEFKLKNYDHFKDMNKEFSDLEVQEGTIKREIDYHNEQYKTKFINKWMLSGIDPLIQEADKILDSFIESIKQESETGNPIPTQIPGKRYIEQMLEAEKCYICERDAPEGSDGYKALENRLNESDYAKAKAQEYKELEFNYTILRNYPAEINQAITDIKDDIGNWQDKNEALFQRRRELTLKKREVEDKYSKIDVQKGAETASKLTKDLILLKDEDKRLARKLDKLNNDIKTCKEELFRSKEQRSKYEDKIDRIVEQELDPYIDVLDVVIDNLKEKALTKLLADINQKANDLYKSYLESSESPRGYISIDPETYEVKVLDDGKQKDINTGNETAAKMSVINAILYLSSQKIGKSYPLIADAPSSVFDRESTQTYTEKISETFEQVIIMSKDYATESDLEFLKTLSTVSTLYSIRNAKIDVEGSDGEINHRTVLTREK